MTDLQRSAGSSHYPSGLAGKTPPWVFYKLSSSQGLFAHQRSVSLAAKAHSILESTIALLLANRQLNALRALALLRDLLEVQSMLRGKLFERSFDHRIAASDPTSEFDDAACAYYLLSV